MKNGSAYTFTWQNGRELASGTKGSTSFAYTYNADGLRTQKVVGNLVYTYYWQGGQLAAMTIKNSTSGTVTATLKFYYDSNGIPFILDYNGTIYFYVTNLQGDVIGLATSEGMVGYYRYDAWGKLISTDSAGSVVQNVLNANPLRYRGYVYDNETGFYYLQSRYYDPAVRRFISADGVGYLGASGDFNSYNLYAYCSNNPIMYTDTNGNLFFSAIAAGAVLGFTIGFLSFAFGQYIASDGNVDEINWNEAMFDGIVGAINGALAASPINSMCSKIAGAVLGGTSSIVSDIIFNNGEIDVSNVLINTVLGGLSGFISGGGADKSIGKFLHSKEILKNTINNNTVRAVQRQFNAMCVHIGELVISAVRYILGNVPTTIVSKQL